MLIVSFDSFLTPSRAFPSLLRPHLLERFERVQTGEMDGIATFETRNCIFSTDDAAGHSTRGLRALFHYYAALMPIYRHQFLTIVAEFSRKIPCFDGHVQLHDIRSTRSLFEEWDHGPSYEGSTTSIEIHFHQSECFSQSLEYVLECIYS